MPSRSIEYSHHIFSHFKRFTFAIPYRYTHSNGTVTHFRRRRKIECEQVNNMAFMCLKMCGYLWPLEPETIQIESNLLLFNYIIYNHGPAICTSCAPQIKCDRFWMSLIGRNVMLYAYMHWFNRWLLSLSYSLNLIDWVLCRLVHYSIRHEHTHILAHIR